MNSQSFDFAELQRVMHDALRAQHPEWVHPNGDSPVCDEYESRFADLLNLFGEAADQRGLDAFGVSRP